MELSGGGGVSLCARHSGWCYKCVGVNVCTSLLWVCLCVDASIIVGGCVKLQFNCRSLCEQVYVGVWALLE